MKTDADVVCEEHRFLWDEVERDCIASAAGGLSSADGLTWEQRLAKRYHDRLFKEYALADMSRYREGAIGLRWRTEEEVLDGRGQFSCGNKACNRSDVPLASYELHFGYIEHGEHREALVKVRCCEECARKLDYRKRKERERRERKRIKREAKETKRQRKRYCNARSRRLSSSSNSDGDDRGLEDGLQRIMAVRPNSND